MMVNRTLVIALLAAWTCTAEAGGDPDTTPPSGFPAWCAGHRGSTETGYMMLAKDLGDNEAEAGGWFAVETVRHLAQAACTWRNNDSAGETGKARAIYQQRRAELMKLAALTDAEMDELLAAELDEQKGWKVEADYCKALEHDDDDDGDTKLTTKESAERNARVQLVCHRVRPTIDAYDWPDASELLKFYASGRCLSSLADGVAHKTTGGVRAVMQFGVCNALISQIDNAKLDADIAKYPPVAREWAKINRGVTLGGVERARTHFTAYAQKHSEWKPVLFDEAAKGYTAFATAYNANKPLFDKAKFLIENSKQHKLVAKLAGCTQEFWAPLAKLVAAKRPATTEAGADAMHDQTTYMLGRGLVACAELDKRADIVSTFSWPLLTAPMGSGPEQSIEWTLVRYINANAEALDASKIEANDLGGFLRNDAMDRETGSLNDIKGIVASVKPAANGWVTVSFKTESWMEDDFDCVETNKIDGIKSDGTLVYRQRCTFKGQSKHSSTEPPVTVEARFAGALKPGRLAKLGETRGAGGDERRAIPAEVRASKDAKAPLVGYLGFSW